MEAEYFAVVDVSDAFTGNVGGARNGVDLLGEEVGEHDDGVKAMGLRELCDQVDSNGLPRAIRYIHRLRVRSGVLGMFPSSTKFTAFYVLFDESTHSRPPVVSFHEFKGRMIAWVSSGGVVVTLPDDLSTQFEIIGDIDAAAMVDQPVFFFPFCESIDQLGGSSASKLLQTF
jgi:hypothetical protein